MPPQQTAQQPQIEPSHYFTFQGFKGMETRQDRVGKDPELLDWCENIIPIGPNYLFTVPAPNAPLATIAGKVITKSFFANFAGTDFQVAFTSDGSGYTINLATGAVVNFAAAATFTNPDCAQWKSERIVIADPTAGYCTYDTKAFAKPGGLSPNIIVTAGGSGYTSGATAAFSGGAGSGATATVQVVGGVVVSVTLTNAGTGYLASDTVTCTITAVGAGSGATATCKVWPQFSLTAQCVAVYAGRVWLAGGRVITFTGTGGYDDAATANASGTTTLPDSDLVHQITCLRALNNYLWIFGDASVKQIGTVSVQASTTIFTIVTLSSDTGTTFPLSVVSYNRLVVFANFTGVYAVLGASVQKISHQMDSIFQNLNTAAPIMHAGLNDIGSGAGVGGGSIRCLMLLVSYVDPVATVTRSLILVFFEQKWFVMNQGATLVSMSTAIINGVLETFASSGPDVSQIVQNQNTPVAILLRTALTAAGKPWKQKRVLRAAVMQRLSTSATMNISVDTENGSQAGSYIAGFAMVWLNAMGQVVTWLNNLAQTVQFFGKGPLFRPIQLQGTGIYFGVTLSGNFSQFSINNIVVEYQEAADMKSPSSQ